MKTILILVTAIIVAVIIACATRYGSDSKGYRYDRWTGETKKIEWGIGGM